MRYTPLKKRNSYSFTLIYFPPPFLPLLPPRPFPHHFLSKSQVSCLRDFHFPRISMLPSVTFSPCNKRAGAIKPCTRIRGEHTRGAARRQSPFVLEIALICQARTGWFCEWRRNHCAITGNERIAEANHPPCRLCIRSPYTAPRFNDRILGMATSRNKGYYPRLVEGKS